jgi:hypothetical protein
VRRIVSWATGVVLAIVIAVPSAILTITIVNRSDAIDEVDRAPTPLIIEPSITETDDATDATLTVTTSAGIEILSGGATGRITAVAITAGVTVRTGDRIYDVNGIARIAAYTPIPFYRDLQSGTVGADVVILKALLATLGVPNTSDPTNTKYDTETGRAVRDLRRLLGDPDATTTFTPDLVVWLPVAEVHVATMMLTVGASSPGLGDPILRGSTTIDSATLALPDNTPFPEGLVGGPVSETATGTVVGQLTDAAGVITPEPTALLAVLAANAASQDATPGQTATRLSVTIRRPAPTQRQVVAASAVMTDASGRATCVWLQDPSGWVAQSVSVHAAEQTGSVALLDPLPSGSHVLANPIEFLAVASCPST